jgi:hypothetical protein
MVLLRQIHLWVLHRLLHLQGQWPQLPLEGLLSLQDLTVQLLQLFLYLLGQLHQLILLGLWHQ